MISILNLLLGNTLFSVFFLFLSFPFLFSNGSKQAAETKTKVHISATVSFVHVLPEKSGGSALLRIAPFPSRWHWLS
jgi:hypothetical protein